MKLLRSTKNKITKKKIETIPHLETTEVVLVHCNIVKIQESCIHLFLINPLVNYSIFHLKKIYFLKPLIQSFYILKYGVLIKILEIEDKINIIITLAIS